MFINVIQGQASFMNWWTWRLVFSNCTLLFDDPGRRTDDCAIQNFKKNNVVTEMWKMGCRGAPIRQAIWSEAAVAVNLSDYVQGRKTWDHGADRGQGEARIINTQQMIRGEETSGNRWEQIRDNETRKVKPDTRTRNKTTKVKQEVTDDRLKQESLV